MRTISRVIYVALLMLVFASVNAGTVRTTGIASIEVSVDVIVITFALDTERSSFAQAATAAKEVASHLEELMRSTDDVVTTVDYDLTFMRQGRWTGGKKLTHRFQMKLAGIPEGEAHGMLVHSIDTALEEVPKLTVTGFTSHLSASREQMVRSQLLERAISIARKRAETLAAAEGFRLGRAQVIDTVPTPRDLLMGNSYGLQDMYVPPRYFQAYGDFSPELELSTRVAVEFELQDE